LKALITTLCITADLAYSQKFIKLQKVNLYSVFVAPNTFLLPIFM